LKLFLTAGVDGDLELVSKKIDLQAAESDAAFDFSGPGSSRLLNLGLGSIAREFRKW